MMRRDVFAALAASALAVSSLVATGQAATLNATVTAVNAVDAERQAQAAAAAPEVGANGVGPLSDSEAQGYGCLLSGGIATGLTAIAGTDELIKIVAGGTIGPATPIAGIVALTGTVFASVCAVGALATPALMRLYDVYYRGLPQVAAP